MEKNIGIPIAVKIFTIILILAGLFFGYVYTLNPGLAFPGTSITDYASQFGFGSAGVRVFGSVFALIICLILNNPRFLIITLTSRVFIELGDVALGLIIGGSMANTIGLTILASLEIWAIIQLIKVIQQKN